MRAPGRTNAVKCRSLNRDANDQHCGFSAGGKPFAQICIVMERGKAGDSQHFVGCRPDDHKPNPGIVQNMLQADAQVIARAFRDQQRPIVDLLDKPRMIAFRTQFYSARADRPKHKEGASLDERPALLADVIADFCGAARSIVDNDFPQPFYCLDSRHDISPKCCARECRSARSKARGRPDGIAATISPG
nr:hypothetical protein [Novosphingobium indicum]